MIEERQMRAVVITDSGGSNRLMLRHCPVPDPRPGEILIRVQAAGMSLEDVWEYEGRASREGRQLPFIPGRESVGIIERVGEHVVGWQPGDAVMSATSEIGHYAEYIAVPAAFVSAAPTSVHALYAAALPIDGLTAYQALTEALSLRAGETLLISVATESVGLLAVQLASYLGAHVIACTKPEHADFLRSLGAIEVIDAMQTEIAEAVRAVHPNGVDAVFDCIGGAMATHCIHSLRVGGRLVSPGNLDHVNPVPGITACSISVRPDGKQLAKLARLVDTEQLKLHLDHVFPMEEAQLAYEYLLTQHRPGKIVLSAQHWILAAIRLNMLFGSEA